MDDAEIREYLDEGMKTFKELSEDVFQLSESVNTLICKANDIVDELKSITRAIDVHE